MGIDIGCRTAVIFSPLDLSCLWQRRQLPGPSTEAFELGANIAAYVTGHNLLKRRLEQTLVVEPQQQLQPVVRGALHIAQLVHNGDWKPHPAAITKLALYLKKVARIDVVTRQLPLNPTDQNLYNHPIVYLTGDGTFTMSDEQVLALRKYLRSGGFLFADAGCGSKAFDRSFRKLMERIFPDKRLERIDTDHELLNGTVGYEIRQVSYTRRVQREHPHLKQPVLEVIELDGRVAVVYTPFDLGLGLERLAGPEASGYSSKDAYRIATNIVLYGLTH